MYFLDPHGIRFNDCVFTEPARLAGWTPPHFAGMLVVQIEDGEWAPRRFQPVFFGEFGNNSRQPLEYADYARMAALAGTRPLYVSVLPMPFTTLAQRRALRDELICAYNPAWQSVSREGRLSSEARFDEARLGEARFDDLQRQPRTPRPSIGFLADLAS